MTGRQEKKPSAFASTHVTVTGNFVKRRDSCILPIIRAVHVDALALGYKYLITIK
jgi:hypothetical protein